MTDEYDKIYECIDKLMDTASDTVIVGIDGRSGAGKTTLCGNLQEKYDCNVFHMDDFFLRPEQRTAERLSAPGENVDHERVLSEVLLPLKEKRTAVYQRYNCRTQSLEEAQIVHRKKLNIIEGAYSFHPNLYEYYDFKIFLNVDADTQKARILIRNGPDTAEKFFSTWIPLEESYIEELDVINKADLIITT